MVISFVTLSCVADCFSSFSVHGEGKRSPSYQSEGPAHWVEVQTDEENCKCFHYYYFSFINVAIILLP